MAYPKFVDRRCRMGPVYGLNTHQLALVSVQIGLERPAVSGLE